MKDWKFLEKEIQPYFTKTGKLNPRLNRDSIFYKMKLEFPWIESLKEAKYCVDNRIEKIPFCEICFGISFFDGKTYLKYCKYHRDIFIKKERDRKISETKKKNYSFGKTKQWAKGKTKETDPRLKELGKKQSKTKKKKFKNGELISWNKGKTKEDSEGMKRVSESVSKRKKGKLTENEYKHILEMSQNNIGRDVTEEEKDKQRQTNLNKYGVSSYLSIVYKDGLKAIKEKYNGSAFLGSEEWKKKKDLYFEKMRKTNLEKYGTESVLSNKEIQNKIQETKRKNHSFSSSKIEKKSIEYLKEKIKEVYVQYKDKRYPFNCDIYLPKYDLFIELNYHWTHGNEPFINSEEQQKVLELWKEKAKESNFYKIAVEVWTKKDVNKFITAEENNLNYKVFYFEKDFYEFVNSLEQEDLEIKYKPIEYTFNEEKLKKEFHNLLNDYKSYNSRKKYTDLVLPFVWELFYKKELELWKDSSIRKKLIQNRISYLHKREEELSDNELLKGFSRSGIYKGYSSFSPLVIKSFIRDFKISSVYDPCGGWGQRLMGSWDIEYWYNDYNFYLVQKIKDLFDYYNNLFPKEKEINFSCRDASTFVPDKKFDAVFTCPPYYKTEDYMFPGDSSKGIDYKEWLNIWWRGVIKSSREVSSIFAFVVSKKYLEDMKNIIEQEGFYLKEKILVSSKKKNHLNISAEEYLLIFMNY